MIKPVIYSRNLKLKVVPRIVYTLLWNDSWLLCESLGHMLLNDLLKSLNLGFGSNRLYFQSHGSMNDEVNWKVKIC